MSWFDFWSSRMQRAEHKRTAMLNPSQRNQLHGNHEVRAELRNETMTSLLPPVGKEVFRRFTPASLEESKQEQEAEKDKKKPEKDKPKPANHLKAGRPLPFIYGDPPPELLSTPLEDLDPFYHSQKTFVVLCTPKIIHRFNAESACYLLSPFNRLRTSAIKILLHQLFSVILILTILTNCIFMTFSDSLLTRSVEYVFLIIYTFEVLVKLLSRGVCCGQFTFLRDPWNWLDVLNITASFTTICVPLTKLDALKTIPRVLKLFSYTPGLKKTTERLVRSLKGLAHVLVLTAFILSILALIGTEFFMGVLRHKCVSLFSFQIMHEPTTLPPEHNFTEASIGYGYFYYQEYINNPENFYVRNHEPLLCGNASDAGVCPTDFTCLKAGMSPDDGYINFDMFSMSLLSVFRLLTQDLWGQLVQLTLRAAGKSYLSVFVLILFPGCFMVVSLIVAAVAKEHVKQEKAEEAEAKRAEEEFRRVVKVLKANEKNGATGGTEVLEESDSPQKKKPATKAHDRVTVNGGEDHLQPLCCSCCDEVLRGDCCSCSQWLKQKLRPFVLHRYFDLAIIACLILNTILMAMDHYPLSYEVAELLHISNLVFLTIFTAELLLKVLALGVKGYFQVRWHILDCVIVITGLLEVMLSDVEGLSVLRSLRLLRPLRLARWWPDFAMLMKIAWFSVGNLGLVLVFVVFMFAVVGMELFQQDYVMHYCSSPSGCELPRWHMVDFAHSILLVFRLLFGDWHETMRGCMEASNKGLCVIYFMVVLVIGNLLVLSLFLSLLLSPLCAKKPRAAEGQEKNKSQTGPWKLEFFRTLIGTRICAETDYKVKSKNNDQKDHMALITVSSEQPPLKDSIKDSSMVELSRSATGEFKIQDEDNDQEGNNLQKLQDNKNQPENTPGDCCWAVCYRCCAIQDVDTSQGVGRVWHRFRKVCLLIVQHRMFEVFMILVILLSSAALVLEDTLLHHRPVLQMVLDKAELVLTCVFLVEMLLKWIAFGFKKYFSSFWCWLDFLILDVSLFSLVGNSLGYSTESLRTLRALRTMRVPSRFKGMRVVLQGMAAAFPSMFSPLLAVLTVWLIFSILGVNLFAGRFSHCFNETAQTPLHWDEVDNMSGCYHLIYNNFTEVQWKNDDFTFDNVGTGFLSLLIMATSDGWEGIMQSAVDSTEVWRQPTYESKFYMYLYFVFFIIFGCFFTANLFIRVFVNALYEQRNKAGGKHVFVTEEQLKFHGKARKMFAKSPEKAAPRPQNRCQAWLFDLVTAPLFEMLVVALICVYVVVMMVLETDNQSTETEIILYYFHFVVLILFCIEFFLKIIALRQHYFSYGLNILDFVVLLLMTIGLFFADLMEKYFVSPIVPPIFRLARISRVLPILRLAGINRVLPFFRWTRGLWTLIVGFMMSIPALLNIGLIFFLVVYTYSFVGMRTFGLIKEEGALDDMTNFETFGNSMISMTLISTSSFWDSLLIATMKTPPDCHQGTPDSPSDCGNPTAGIIFFSSYILLYLLLVVHLFVAVVLESFNSSELEEAELLQMFYNTWSKFDPEASQVIQYRELSDFCDALQDPLRIPKPNSIRLTYMDLPLLPGDQICCNDVLLAVMTQAFGEAGHAKLEELSTNNPAKASHEPISSTMRRKQEEVAAAVIQRAFRKHQVQNGADGDQPTGATTGVSSQ
ncbi:sodium channel protein type 3 subunit alpha isoform X2 [Fundulus heteroclitus]|uniref:sodium channel protein type 3 subunit alpha isoform X2 n=1 Tax=Fundulus heteroclitus TaxID=8078 RepID=UPI00165B0702|nr:sodium channel protein type 3 subunit alpha isoform X2 [Fundulus heteroclitus]